MTLLEFTRALNAQVTYEVMTRFNGKTYSQHEIASMPSRERLAFKQRNIYMIFPNEKDDFTLLISIY